MKYITKLSRSIKKRSVLATWIIIMFMLVLIACFMMGIYFYNMNTTLERNLTAYNTSKTEHVSTEVDASSMRLAIQASNIAGSLETQMSELSHSLEARAKILSDLAVQLELNRDIFGVYIYLRETDEIISVDSIVKEKYFYSGNFDTKLFSYDEWKNFLKSEESDYFELLPLVDIQGKNLYRMTYVLNLDDSKGKVMVSLNIGSVTAGDPYYSKLLVVDEEGKVYNLYGENDEGLSLKKLSEEGKMTEYAGGSYVSYVTSKLLGLKYVIFTDKNVLNKDLNELHTSSILYMLIFLCIGLVFAWIVSLRQYKPLGGILAILKREASGNEIEKKNEYVEIEDSITKMMQEKVSLAQKAQKNEIYIKENAVAMLLNGRKLSKEKSRMLPQSGGYMSAVLIVYNEEKSEQFESDFELLQFAAKNISKEIFSEVAQVYMSATNLTGTVSLLLSFNEKEEDCKERLTQASEKFIEVMRVQLGIDADVVIGRVTENLDNIPAIYNEVREASLLCSNNGTVIDASVLTERNFEVYDYSISTEMGIIACIKKGDYTGAYALIRNELDEILYKRNCPIYIIRCFMVEIAGTILKAAGEIERESGSTGLSNTSNVGKLFSATTIAEMELLLQEYLKEVCDCIAQSNSSKTSPICEEIKQYVRENYYDSEMNVNAIAAKFYLNSAYLSNMFKRNTGIKLLEYINRVRIDEAKKMMLENPHIAIEELAEKSGFANSRTFRRIFLKHENTSPSKFAKP